jgi:hypothetical protein
LYTSTFVEQETAEPAPTPVDQNNSDLVFAPEDEAELSDDEIEEGQLFKY